MNYSGQHGGQRPGAGRKPQNQPFLEVPANTTEIERIDGELEPIDMPAYDDCLKAIERDGSELGADKIFKEMYDYVYKFGCKDIVPKDLIENYALHRSRFLKCQRELTRLGYIAAHPTTKGPIATPYAALMNLFDKSQNHAFFQIMQFIRDNNSNGFIVHSEKDYAMEQILDS